MRYILILLWFLLGVGYCSIANICASETNEESSPTITAKEVPCPSIESYYFNWSSEEALTTDQWSKFMTSLLEEMKETSKVRITGLYNNKEINASSFENLGMARASDLAEKMGLDENLYQLASDSLRNIKYSIDCRLPAAKIRLVTVSEKIKEIDDKTLIYFPVNSINKLADKEVESYLDDLVERVLRTGELIKLDGNTDNSGTEDYNLELGNRRAAIIQDYLISRNVKSKQIQIESFGDTRPIESNETEKGRAANRRVELKVLSQ